MSANEIQGAASQSLITTAVTAKDISSQAGLALSPGDVVQAKVVSSTSNGTGDQRALQIAGQTIPAEIPANIPIGAELTLEVVAIDDQIELKVIAKSPSTPSAAPDPAKIAISALIEATHVSETELSGLKEVLKTSLTREQSVTTATLPKNVIETLQTSLITSDKSLSLDQLEKLILNAATPDAARPLLTLVTAARNDTAEKLFSTLSPEFQQVAEKLAESLTTSAAAQSKPTKDLVTSENQEKLKALLVQGSNWRSIPPRTSDHVVREFSSETLAKISELQSDAASPEEIQKVLLAAKQSLGFVIKTAEARGPTSVSSFSPEAKTLLGRAYAALEVATKEIEPKPAVSPGERISNVLQSIASQPIPATEETTRALTKFVREHVAFLQSADSALTAVLERTSKDHGTALVLHTLEVAERAEVPAQAKLAREFKAFAEALKVQLDRSAGKPSAATIESAISKLEQRFTLPAPAPTGEFGLASGVRPVARPELPREIARLVVTLDAQLKTLDTELNGSPIPLPVAEPSAAEQKLLQALGSLSRGVGTELSTFEQSVRSFIRSQVDSLQSFEVSLKEFIHSIDHDDDLATLLKSLGRLPEKFGSLANSEPLAKSLLNFARELEKRVLGASTLPDPDSGLRRVLSEALAEIGVRFGTAQSATPATDALGLPIFRPAPTLPFKEARAIQSIEAQIRSVLANPKLGEASDPADVKQSAESLANLVASATQSLGKTLSRDVQSYREVLGKLAADLRTAAAKEISADDLKKLLTKSLNEIHQNLGISASTSGLDSEIGGEVSRITQQLQKLLGLAGATPAEAKAKVPAPAAITEALMKLSKSGLGQETLTDLLKSLGSRTPEHQTPTQGLEHQFMDFLRDLAKDLGESEKSAPLQRELLKHAQQKMRAHFSPDSVQTGDPAALQNALSGLQGMENILRGQEALARLNPIMQAVGEPAMILFPTLVQGFLSQVELSWRPQKDSSATEEKKQGGNSGAGFHQATFSTTLPGLGLASVHLAHRQHELHLSMTFESTLVADFVNQKLPTLESLLREKGFTELSLVAEQGTAKSVQPEWVQDILRPKSVVA